MRDENGENQPNEDWDPRYDLNAAAADIWLEKAAVVSADYSEEISDSGVSLYKAKGDLHKQYTQQHRRYWSRRAVRSRGIGITV